MCARYPALVSPVLAVDPPLDGVTNMERDRELLRLAEIGISGCRLYTWDGPWVSLGRFQAATRDLVDPEHTQWVLRPTGGKAVLHGHDVTVGLAMPLRNLGLESRALKPAYRAMVDPIVRALRTCGVMARLAEDTRFGNRGNRTSDCFAFSSPNDVVDEVTGAKVCGCALRLTESGILLQASIPNGPALVHPESVIRNAVAIHQAWDATNFEPALREALNEMSLGAAAGRRMAFPSSNANRCRQVESG
jgi:lipoate-protein ligase A